MLIDRKALEVRASRYPKTLGMLTGLGDLASTTRPCKYFCNHKKIHADLLSVRESIPKVSWNKFLDWTDKQAIAEGEVKI